MFDRFLKFNSYCYCSNDMNLCTYKDIFGKPNEGLHSYRFCGVAIVDVVLTVMLAYAISAVTKYIFFNVLMVLFLVAIITHYLFCVDTTVNVFLFGKSQEESATQ